MSVEEKCMEILERAIEEEHLPEEDCPPEVVVSIAKRFFTCGVRVALRLSDERRISEDIEDIKKWMM